MEDSLRSGSLPSKAMVQGTVTPPRLSPPELSGIQITWFDFHRMAERWGLEGAFCLLPSRLCFSSPILHKPSGLHIHGLPFLSCFNPI